MRRISWFCLLVFGFLLSWTVVYAADFYVIPVKKCCTCKGTLNGTRWCDNGDGTVTDMTTCLVWLKYAIWRGKLPWRSNTPDDYDDAHTQAGLLKDGTLILEIPEILLYIYLTDGSVQGDWRLPTLTELDGITEDPEPVRADQPREFVYVQASYYWSSTTYSDPPGAYAVEMLKGTVGVGLKSALYYVWPVRNGN